MDSSWTQRAVAEFIGTFTLIFIGAGSICLDSYTNGGVGLLGIALAHGLAIAVMVSSAGHISGGHFNPAVTISMLSTKKISPGMGLTYIVSQLAGATIAALLLREVFPQEAWEAAKLGTPALAENISHVQGMLIEAILTFFLVYVIWGTAVDKRGPSQVAGLAIGLTITLDILAGGPLTGASMNPARTFGPALAGGYWGAHYVYWIAPIAGGLIAGFIYNGILIKGK
jgi:MIP family channel proteins